MADDSRLSISADITDLTVAKSRLRAQLVACLQAAASGGQKSCQPGRGVIIFDHFDTLRIELGLTSSKFHNNLRNYPYMKVSTKIRDRPWTWTINNREALMKIRNVLPFYPDFFTFTFALVHAGEHRTPGSPQATDAPRNQPSYDGSDDFNLDFLEDWVFPATSPPPSFFLAPTATSQGDPPDSHLAQYRQHYHGNITGSSDELLVVVSEAELCAAEANIRLASAGCELHDFSLPPRYAVIRYIRAYSRFFEPHAPIVPLQTFNISVARPILVLAVLSLGAMYLDEAEVASNLFAAARRLLAKHDEDPEVKEDGRHGNSWELVARLLICLYGTLSSDPSLRRHPNRSFATITDIIQDAARDLGTTTSEESWVKWLDQEATIRCIAWYVVTAAMLHSLEG
ncbi:hypothetical protein AYO20_04677 [Fonsecaea nubica]|uniref:Xylanolytic transcriptional activator regulatory domain-containing protein n=1 Tax=Fonsecaea nubica TaxID=856822 RepID=A0A178D2Q9_9EURO|nr:hypothetical protein AYO20_04677 [Fonsecaea nubica]OAL36016.1 hypothetical protein AYO20_04677 [Fonsecaea nubica]